MAVGQGQALLPESWTSRHAMTKKGRKLSWYDTDTAANGRRVIYIVILPAAKNAPAEWPPGQATPCERGTATSCLPRRKGGELLPGRKAPVVQFLKIRFAFLPEIQWPGGTFKKFFASWTGPRHIFISAKTLEKLFKRGTRTAPADHMQPFGIWTESRPESAGIGDGCGSRSYGITEHWPAYPQETGSHLLRIT